MHMSDALLSAPVAIAADIAAAALLAVAAVKVKKDRRENIIPLMGVMGAFIFAAQMVNFAIPGTGSSGHIVGGVLLAALLGPWAAFITLSSVIIIQCLVFADGGLMALGCNILNMGAVTTLVAFPLLFKPFDNFRGNIWKITGVSLLACVGGLEMGACMVTLETLFSGITALPALQFLMLMAGIHLAIGIGEGLATGAVLSFIGKTRPDMLTGCSSGENQRKRGVGKLALGFAIAAVVIGGGLAFLASEKPDGLEWSIQKTAGTAELPQEHQSALSEGADKVQTATAVMPDYDNKFSGIAGAAMVVLLVWGVTLLMRRRRIPAETGSDISGNDISGTKQE